MKVPKWLGSLFATLIPKAGAIIKAVGSAWTQGGAAGAACLGLAKLSRHMAQRCNDLAKDAKTGDAADKALYAAQVFLDKAAEELKKAGAAL